MSEIEKDSLNTEEAAEEIVEETTEAVEETTEAVEETVEEAAETDPAAELEAKVAALEEAAAADKDKYLRLLAEYDNFRKRSIQEKLNAAHDATAKAALEVIAVIDNFERAVAADCTDENYKKGVEMTFKQFSDVFKSLGIESFGEVGEEFDPNIHNAVMHIEDDNYGENIVVDEFQKGYTYRDTVVRHSMVRVAN